MRIPRIRTDVWYDIPGYNGKYQINYYGQVRRALLSGKYKALNGHIKKVSRRRVVKLNEKEQTVPKLMQRTFIGELPSGYVLHHKNNILHDDALPNLEVITYKQLGEISGKLNGRNVPIAKMNAEGEIVEFYKSVREAGRRNYMSYQTILDRINNKTKKLFASDGYAYTKDDDASIAAMIRAIELHNVKECGVNLIDAPQVEFEF